jgi:hypothetical protein
MEWDAISCHRMNSAKEKEKPNLHHNQLNHR